MKKLLIAEMVAIAVSVVIVIIGSIMGWTNEATAIVAVAVAVTTIAISLPYGEFIAVAAGTTVTFTGLATVIAMDVGVGAAVVVAFAGAFLLVTLAVSGVEDLKGKYPQALLSLLVESVIVSTVLVYGPALIRSLV